MFRTRPPGLPHEYVVVYQYYRNIRFVTRALRSLISTALVHSIHTRCSISVPNSSQYQLLQTTNHFREQPLPRSNHRLEFNVSNLKDLHRASLSCHPIHQCQPPPNDKDTLAPITAPTNREVSVPFNVIAAVAAPAAFWKLKPLASNLS